jgi:hypothetical protein
MMRRCQNSGRLDWSPMNYRNSEMKLDQLVGYLNEEKINLSPVFQRGHIWKMKDRKKLVVNIVQGKPIPAIFLYKEPSGTRYSYNILDGKQRLESLILFIGNRQNQFSINRWDKYFFDKKLRSEMGFEIDLPDGKKSFDQLDDTVVRDLREYAIPTIEISLTDSSSLDEVIDLFVDINQQGAPVTRFDVVKAMGKSDPLLLSVFDLIAVKQRRGQDMHYRTKRNAFTVVLRELKLVASIPVGNQRVDRMWERLIEIVLFVRTKKHRAPSDILKGFIKVPDQRSPRLTSPEMRELMIIFGFLEFAYKTSDLPRTALATNQIHFYIMVTALIERQLLTAIPKAELIRKLVAFGKILEGRGRKPRNMGKYIELSQKQTTHVARREERLRIFVDVLSEL